MLNFSLPVKAQQMKHLLNNYFYLVTNFYHHTHVKNTLTHQQPQVKNIIYNANRT